MQTRALLSSIITLASALSSLSQSSAETNQWTPLFNGKDLTGWHQVGGKADYQVEDGSIVGRAVASTPNSFLCTDREYGDFVLEYEFKVDPRLNSGVQFRSNISDTPTVYQVDGKEIKVPANRFHGYQAEIDPDPKRNRMWSTGIYDESRRGWLYPGALGGDKEAFSEQGRETLKPNGWNKVRIVAIGSSISTWLNGVPRASINDDLSPSGLIGLQVHNIPNKELVGAMVQWRNIRILEVSPDEAGLGLSEEDIAAGWLPFWDGKSGFGWHSVKTGENPDRGWEIKDGVLTVNKNRGGDIASDQRYRAFELELEVQLTEGANSGIKYFCQPNLDMKSGKQLAPPKGSSIGFEYQLIDDAKHPDANQGKDGNRAFASLYDLITADRSKQATPIGEWNKVRLVCDGKTCEHWLNGKKVVDFQLGGDDIKDRIAKSKYRNIPGFGLWEHGNIVLQDHGDRVSFRKVKLRIPAY